MRKHCGFLSILGLTAMMGLMASQARAETMTLTVYAGSGTSGAVIYSTTGGSNAVSANITTLNGNLAAAGFGAYTFSNLGGSSNFTSSSASEQHILAAGGMTVTPGGTGESTPITILLTEDGFRQPPIGNTLADAAAASFGGSTGSSANTGTFSGTPGSVSPSTITDLTSPTSTASAAITSTPIPYALGSESVITLDSVGGTAGTLTFSNQVSVAGVPGVPEPASLVMMLTGMPLPLVVLGILRRRRAAA
jgi:hypothetical protein